MYKKLSLDELIKIDTKFVPHLVWIIQKERYQGVNDFFKYAFKEGNELLFFEKGHLLVKMILKDNIISIFDDVEKIEIEVPADNKGKLNDLVKKFIIKKGRLSGQKTIEELLMEKFTTGAFLADLWKPYLVYDIETELIKGDFKKTEYYLWYSFEEIEPGKGKYECILKEDLEKFVEKMLNFDGYIVGFNQIFFDNPVCIYNLGLSEDKIQILNEKSIDLFVFVYQLTQKRIGLNKICDALVNVTKTLDSGADVESLRADWKNTWNQKILEKVKTYCKNDVRMTTLLFFYFLHFKKIFMDDEEYTFTIDDLIHHEKDMKEEKEVKIQEQRLF